MIFMFFLNQLMEIGDWAQSKGGARFKAAWTATRENAL